MGRQREFPAHLLRRLLAGQDCKAVAFWSNRSESRAGEKVWVDVLGEELPEGVFFSLNKRGRWKLLDALSTDQGLANEEDGAYADSLVLRGAASPMNPRRRPHFHQVEWKPLVGSARAALAEKRGYTHRSNQQRARPRLQRCRQRRFEQHVELSGGLDLAYAQEHSCWDPPAWSVEPRQIAKRMRSAQRWIVGNTCIPEHPGWSRVGSQQPGSLPSVRKVLAWKSAILTADALRRDREEHELADFNQLEDPSFPRSPQHCMACFERNAWVHAGCGHTMCEDCWRQYVQVKVAEADVSSLCCAAPKCDERLPISMVRSLLSDTAWQRLQEMLDDLYVSTAARISYCPTPACRRVLKCSPGAELAACASCGGSWCPQCGRASHWPACCEQVPEDIDELENCLPLTKRCPNCATLIEKNGGCPHMQCRQCKVHFCWECGAHSMTAYPHYAGVLCEPTKPWPQSSVSFDVFTSLGLSGIASLNIASLERQYSSTLARFHKEYAKLDYSQLLWHAVALESALVLRHVAWHFRGRREGLSSDLVELLKQLHRFHTAVAQTAAVPWVRRGKARTSLVARFESWISRFARRLSES